MLDKFKAPLNPVSGATWCVRQVEGTTESCFRSDLGKSINTDEAAALGAVYQAAFLGKGFKVKTFHVRDANIFPINVSITRPLLAPH